MKTGLEDLLSTKKSQRLSIADVHRFWNDELHIEAGHTQYASKSITRVAGGSQDPEALILDATTQLRDVMKRDTWENTVGEEARDSDIKNQLIGFIEKGLLPVYESEDPSIFASAPDALKGVNFLVKLTVFFIDREDLGCLLTKHSTPLPAFWYSKSDEVVFQDRLKREAEGKLNTSIHIDLLIKENESLKQELFDARPFMNPEHPLFSAELEAAVAVWLEHYIDKDPESPSLAKKRNLANWLEVNRPGAVQSSDGSTIPKAIERITMIANPIKSGGRPRKEVPN